MTVGDSAGSLIGVSIFWAVISIVGLFVVPKSRPDRGLIQCLIVTAAICCWLFWLCITLSQVNPLFGPELEVNILRIVQAQWGP